MCIVLTYLDDRRDIMAISLDATLQSETKVLQSQSRTRWMCGVRAPSVYSLRPQDCWILLLSTFSIFFCFFLPACSHPHIANIRFRLQIQFYPILIYVKPILWL